MPENSAALQLHHYELRYYMENNVPLLLVVMLYNFPMMEIPWLFVLDRLNQLKARGFDPIITIYQLSDDKVK